MVKIDVESAKRLMQCMEKSEFYTRPEIEEGASSIKREINREILNRPTNDEGNQFTLKLIGLPREVCLCELILKLTSYGLIPTWIKVDDFSKTLIHAFVICAKKVEKFININIKLSGQDVMTASPLRSPNYFAAKGFEHSMVRWSPNEETPTRVILLTRTKNSELKQKSIPRISDYYYAILKGYSNESIEDFVTRYFNESDMPVLRSQEFFLDHSRARSRSPLNYSERAKSPPRYSSSPRTSQSFHENNRDIIVNSISRLEKQNRENERHLQGVKKTIENFQRQAFKLENIIQESNEEINKLKSQINYL